MSEQERYREGLDGDGRRHSGGAGGPAEVKKPYFLMCSGCRTPCPSDEAHVVPNWNTDARGAAYSPSGDWSQLVTYYYREDGTLAKTRNTFASFHIRGRIVKETVYGADGGRLRTRLRHFELGENGRGRRKGCSADYSDYDADVYAKVESLPLYPLPRSRR